MMLASIMIWMPIMTAVAMARKYSDNSSVRTTTSPSTVATLTAGTAILFEL